MKLTPAGIYKLCVASCLDPNGSRVLGVFCFSHFLILISDILCFIHSCFVPWLWGIFISLVDERAWTMSSQSLRSLSDLPPRFSRCWNSEELIYEETQKDTAKSRQIKDRGSTANSNISEFSLNPHIALHTKVNGLTSKLPM